MGTEDAKKGREGAITVGKKKTTARATWKPATRMISVGGAVKVRFGNFFLWYVFFKGATTRLQIKIGT